MAVHRGDTLKNFMRLILHNRVDFEIVKVVIQCGVVQKEIENPPIDEYFYVSFTSAESKKFKNPQCVHISVYNSDGEKFTFDKFAKFFTLDEVVKDGQ